MNVQKNVLVMLLIPILLTSSLSGFENSFFTTVPRETPPELFESQSIVPALTISTICLLGIAYTAHLWHSLSVATISAYGSGIGLTTFAACLGLAIQVVAPSGPSLDDHTSSKERDLEILADSHSTLSGRQSAARTLYLQRDHLIPSDAVRIAQAVEKNNLTDPMTIGWILMGLNQRSWHGISERQRASFLSSINSYAARQKHFLPSQEVAWIRPIFSAVSLQEHKQPLRENLSPWWTSKRRSKDSIQEKVMIVRRTIKTLQDEDRQLFIPEKRIRERLGLAEEQISGWLRNKKVSPFFFCILQKNAANEAVPIAAALPVLWKTPGSPTKVVDVATLLHTQSGILKQWATAAGVSSTQIYISETAHQILDQPRNQRPPTLLQGGLWKYLRERGVQNPEKLASPPSPLEKREVRRFIRSIIAETADGHMQELRYSALVETPVSAGGYTFVLRSLVDRAARAQPALHLRVMTVLQRYGLLKTGVKPLEKITSLDDFRRFYELSPMENVPWARTTLQLKQAVVRALAEQQHKDLIWLDSLDFRESLLNITNSQGRTLTVRGLYRHFEKQQKAEGTKLYGPFYLLKQLKLIDENFPYEDPLEMVQTKRDLVDVLKRKSVQNLPWRRMSKKLIAELVLEMAFRLNKPIQELVPRDYNTALKDLGLRVWQPREKKFKPISLATVYRLAAEDPARPAGMTATDYLHQTLWPEGEPRWITLPNLALAAGVDVAILLDQIRRGVISAFYPTGCENLRPIRIEASEAQQVMQWAQTLHHAEASTSLNATAVESGKRKSSSISRRVSQLSSLIQLAEEGPSRDGIFERVLEVAESLSAWLPATFLSGSRSQKLSQAFHAVVKKNFYHRIKDNFPHLSSDSKKDRLLEQALNQFVDQVLNQEPSIVPANLFLDKKNDLSTLGSLVVSPLNPEFGVGLVTDADENGVTNSARDRLRVHFSDGFDRQFRVPKDQTQFGREPILTFIVSRSELRRVYKTWDQLSGNPILPNSRSSPGSTKLSSPRRVSKT
jgi:hypothetical protein